MRPVCVCGVGSGKTLIKIGRGAGRLHLHPIFEVAQLAFALELQQGAALQLNEAQVFAPAGDEHHL